MLEEMGDLNKNKNEMLLQNEKHRWIIANSFSVFTSFWVACVHARTYTPYPELCVCPSAASGTECWLLVGSTAPVHRTLPGRATLPSSGGWEEAHASHESLFSIYSYSESISCPHALTRVFAAEITAWEPSSASNWDPHLTQSGYWVGG